MARIGTKRNLDPGDEPGKELVFDDRTAEQVLAEQIVARAREEGLDLVGPSGFLGASDFSVV